MVKTTVYLSEEEAAELRRAAAASGKSQSELIREGVRRVVREAPPRVFHSLGKGEGPPYKPVDPDEFADWLTSRHRGDGDRR